MSTLPIDLEVAMRGWAAAARLRAIAARASDALLATDDLSAANVAAILGTALGAIDALADELDAVEVEL